MSVVKVVSLASVFLVLVGSLTYAQDQMEARKTMASEFFGVELRHLKPFEGTITERTYYRTRYKFEERKVSGFKVSDGKKIEYILIGVDYENIDKDGYIHFTKSTIEEIKHTLSITDKSPGHFKVYCAPTSDWRKKSYECRGLGAAMENLMRR